ncbi:sortase-associated OmpA-like protein PdsO [Thaumasiovibrio subtropicus]|uniref:sortase-associated OmpA-like protein PdsO n=1 Tax=Thaumasiovibrio subtropicus TaxID=1891207 RepID=UPI000B35E340|nr:sortase-associated OmpA-like protein PdsO [Thaumasiovibrio subtropicus]
MKKAAIVTLISSALLVSNVHASEDQTSQHQMYGIGGGATIGALVGGPAGAVIGAIVGGLVGTSSGLEAESRDQAEQIVQLTTEKAALEGVQRDYQLAQRDNAHLRQSLQAMHVAPQPLNINVQFQTGSYTLAAHYQEQLDTIADMMVGSEDQTWLIEGHADRRGDAEENLALSQMRAETVREYLIQRGVEPSQLLMDAYGDTLPVMEEETLENNVYDRRVSISYMGMSMVKE